MNGHLNESNVQCPKPIRINRQSAKVANMKPNVKRIRVFPLGALGVLAVKSGALWTSPLEGYTFAHGKKVEVEYR